MSLAIGTQYLTLSRWMLPLENKPQETPPKETAALVSDISYTKPYGDTPEFDNTFSQGELSLSMTLVKLIDRLSAERVAIPDTQAVTTYLDRYSDQINAIFQIIIKTRQAFKPSDECSLEVHHGIEPEDESLALVIRQWEYDQDLLDKADKITEPYTQNLRDYSGFFFITSDFRKPKS